ncbi:MAG: hypothetical protein ACKOTB_06475, partial [Planctomycetia bacterium]
MVPGSLVVLLVAAVTPEAAACPFCGAVGPSLAERRDAADVVAVGEAHAVTQADAAGRMTQRFRIDQRLRGTEPVVGRLVTADVDRVVDGTALLFGRIEGATVHWQALAADETLLGHVAAAPPVARPAVERLRWFATRLEHPDPAIAADAFAEFGRADFAAVRAAADQVDPAALREWVGADGIDGRRRGLYGLLLGIAASGTSDPDEATACVNSLEHALDTSADDFRAGFDGILAGLLVAEGTRGLDALARRGLFSADARPLDQKHLLAALRFAAESLTATIPRSRIVAATADRLGRPAVSAVAAAGLARYAAGGACRR